MKIRFSDVLTKKLQSFDSIPKKKLLAIVENLEKAKSLREIPNIKSLKNATGLYRIRTGDYRLIIEQLIDGEIIILLLDYRKRGKDTYKDIPKK